MRVELHSAAKRVGVRRQRPMQVEVERVVAGVAVDIVDVDMHLRSVADVEEARQGRGDDDRVAHGDVGLGRADLVLVQATAASRTVPLNDGRSKVTVALP